LNLINQKINKELAYYVFFAISSFFMIFGINFSFFVFLNILKKNIINRSLNIFRINGKYGLIIITFILGAVLSSFSTLKMESDEFFFSSLSVLPNYVYWGILLLLMISLSRNYLIDYLMIFKYISISFLVVILYYFFLQDIIANKFFFKKFLENNFAFLMLCFTPYVVFYVKKRFSFFRAFLFLLIILIIMLYESRRAGFVLVLLGGFYSLIEHRIKFFSIKNIIINILIVLAFFSFMQLNFTKKIIYQNSERIYNSIYNSEDLTYDRSSLVRKAMIEKGLILFSDNIFFGVGLNNFQRSDALIKGDFQGSEFVVDKDIFQNISSHNSYVNILAEGGLFLAVPFYLLFIFIIFDISKSFNILSSVDKVIFASFLCMSIHLFFINGIINSLAWLNVALALTSVLRIKNYLK